MPRRREVPKREILPDPKFGNVELSKFMNVIMEGGKKAVAERIIYGALDLIEKKNPDIKIEVQGHTDNVGSAEVNQALSERRAKSAASYLESKGIAPGRIATSGKGLTQPIADNSTAEGRALNRRVVLSRTNCTR